jgi:positive regulator of sigma E activity
MQQVNAQPPMIMMNRKDETSLGKCHFSATCGVNFASALSLATFHWWRRRCVVEFNVLPSDL